MASALSAKQRKKTRELAPMFLLEHSVNDLTFDTVFQEYPLGRTIHTLFINALSNVLDSELREYLADIGVTYDVLLENTRRVRQNSREPFDMSDIKPFQEIRRSSNSPKTSKSKHKPETNTNTPDTKIINEVPHVVASRATAISQVSQTNGRYLTRHGAPELEHRSSKTRLEEARIVYCEWVSKIGVRGVSEIILQVEPKNELDDLEHPQRVKIGRFEKNRPEILDLARILKSAGELEIRGVHGYVPVGKLDLLSREVTAKKRFI